MNAMNLIESGTFAEACFNNNSIAELESALAGQPDPTDLATWGITPDEWREQINLALAAKREDAE